MALKLGYLGLEVSDLAAWERFAGLVGLGTAGHDDVTCLLVDDYARRLQLAVGPRDDLVYMGWEAADYAEFDAVSSATLRSRTPTVCRSRLPSGSSASPRRGSRRWCPVAS